MSEEVELNVRVTDRDLEQLNLDLAKMKNEAKDLVLGLQESGRALKDASKNYHEFNKAVLDSGTRAVPAYKKALSDLGGAVREGQIKSLAFAGALRAMGAELSRMRQVAKAAAVEEKELNTQITNLSKRLVDAVVQADRYEQKVLNLAKANSRLRKEIADLKKEGSGKYNWIDPFEGMYRSAVRFYVLFQTFKTALKAMENAAASVDWEVTLPFLNPNYVTQMEKAKKLTDGMVSTYQLQKSFALMSSFNLPMENFGETMKLVTAMAQRTGQSADYLLQSYGVGISRLSPKILDNLGIQIKLADEYARFRVATGQVSGELDDYTKKVVAADAAQREMKRSLGGLQDQMGVGVQSNIKRIGTFLENAANDVLGGVVTMADAAAQNWSENTQDKIARLWSGRWITQDMFGSSGGLGVQYNTWFRDTFRVQDETWNAIFKNIDDNWAQGFLHQVENSNYADEAEVYRKQMLGAQKLRGAYRGQALQVFERGAELSTGLTKTLTDEFKDLGLDEVNIKNVVDAQFKDFATGLANETADLMGKAVWGVFNGSRNKEQQGQFYTMFVQHYLDDGKEAGLAGWAKAKIEKNVRALLEPMVVAAKKMLAQDNALKDAMAYATDIKSLFDVKNAETPLDAEMLRIGKEIDKNEAAVKKLVDFINDEDNAGKWDAAEMTNKLRGLSQQLAIEYDKTHSLERQKEIHGDINKLVDGLNDRVYKTKDLTADGLKSIIAQANELQRIFDVMDKSETGALLRQMYLQMMSISADGKKGPRTSGGRKKETAGDRFRKWMKSEVGPWMQGQWESSAEDHIGPDRPRSDKGLLGNLGGLLFGAGDLGSSRDKMVEWEQQFEEVQQVYRDVYTDLDDSTRTYVNGLMVQLQAADQGIYEHIRTLDAWKEALTGVGEGLSFMREGMDKTMEGDGWTQNLFGSDVINMVDGMASSLDKMNDALGTQNEAYGLVTASAPALRAFTKELGANLRQQAALEMLMNAAAAWAAAATFNYPKMAMHIAAASLYGLVAAKVVRLPSRSADSSAGARGSASRGTTEINIHINGDVVQTEAERGVMVHRAMEAARAEGAI